MNCCGLKIYLIRSVVPQSRCALRKCYLFVIVSPQLTFALRISRSRHTHPLHMCRGFCPTMSRRPLVTRLVPFLRNLPSKLFSTATSLLSTNSPTTLFTRNTMQTCSMFEANMHLSDHLIYDRRSRSD